MVPTALRQLVLFCKKSLRTNSDKFLNFHHFSKSLRFKILHLCNVQRNKNTKEKYEISHCNVSNHFRTVLKKNAYKRFIKIF